MSSRLVPRQARVLARHGLGARRFAVRDGVHDGAMVNLREHHDLAPFLLLRVAQQERVRAGKGQRGGAVHGAAQHRTAREVDEQRVEAGIEGDVFRERVSARGPGLDQAIDAGQALMNLIELGRCC